MTRKRDRLEIIRDMLETIRDKKNVKPTHIMYRANLSHQMLKEYMAELEAKHMVEITEKKSKKSFHITDKGLGYLKDYDLVRGFVDSYGLE